MSNIRAIRLKNKRVSYINVNSVKYFSVKEKYIEMTFIDGSIWTLECENMQDALDILQV